MKCWCVKSDTLILYSWHGYMESSEVRGDDYMQTEGSHIVLSLCFAVFVSTGPFDRWCHLPAVRLWDLHTRSVTPRASPRDKFKYSWFQSRCLSDLK